MEYSTVCLLLMAWLGHGYGTHAGTMDTVPPEPLREDSFVRTADVGMCNELWSTWPAVQERAIENGTVMIWKMGTSIGNIMKTFMFVLPVRSLVPTGDCLSRYGRTQRFIPRYIRGISQLFPYHAHDRDGTGLMARAALICCRKRKTVPSTPHAVSARQTSC